MVGLGARAKVNPPWLCTIWCGAGLLLIKEGSRVPLALSRHSGRGITWTIFMLGGAPQAHFVCAESPWLSRQTRLFAHPPRQP